MLYYSWDMARDTCNCYFSFWTIFCPFTPLTVQKMKISKKWKKDLEILSFYTSVPKIMIICYTVPEIWCMTDAIVIFHFRLFFALLPQKSNFLKNEKNTWRYHHFTHVYQTLWLDDVRFLRNGVQQTDGQKNWHIEVGAPPKNTKIWIYQEWKELL